MNYFYISFALLVFLFLSCDSPEKKEEKIAKKYCSSCHVFPSPALLDKQSWQTGVLPEMKFRMGLDNSKLWNFSESELKMILPSMLSTAMVTNEEWKAIENFYLRNAPDTLQITNIAAADTTLPFIVEKVKLPLKGTPFGTLIKKDSLNNLLYYGTRLGDLYRLSTEFVLIDSFNLKTPASDIIYKEKTEPLLLGMGIMDPNDYPKGKLVSLNLKTSNLTTILDSLQRPVHVEETDFDNDGLKDFIICSFGNYTGNLVAFQQKKDGSYKKYILENAPGARKVIVKDFDNNGLPDILVLMTQGDEQIILLHNYGNFKFRITSLLRFPPVYGSSYFDIGDFNGDGKFDILYTNGDNGDFSMILKPYHGIRIFLNDGTNRFTEDLFIFMHGASKAIARDFDQDGDIDIAAISFFPDFKNTPEQGFVFFENRNNKYFPRVTNLGKGARWIVMEEMDIDNNGSMDLVLAALNFPTNVPQELFQQWEKDPIHFLVLKNKLNQAKE
jgi:hypothetical protein